MFKLLQQTTVSEDFADDASSTMDKIGSAFAAGYKGTKDKMNADKAAAAAEAEKNQKLADKDKAAADKAREEEAQKMGKNERLQDVIHSIFTYLPTPPMRDADQQLLDKDGNIKDPVWHQMTAEELQFIGKYVKRVDKTFGQFRVELEKRLKSSNMLTKPQRDEVPHSLMTGPKEIDSQTHINVNRGISDEIISTLKSANLKYGLDACMAVVKKYAEAIDKTPVLSSGPGPTKAPLAVDRGIAMIGAVLNNYQEHIGNVLAAIEGHEFEQVLNPVDAQKKSQEQEAAMPALTAQQLPKQTPAQAPDAEEPVKEVRRLVGFRPLTESEV